jgi:hypothetical protein
MRTRTATALAALVLGALAATAASASEVGFYNKSDTYSIYVSFVVPGQTVEQHEVKPGKFSEWKVSADEKFTGTWKIEAETDASHDGYEEVANGQWWFSGKDRTLEWGEFKKTMSCPLEADNSKHLSYSWRKIAKVDDQQCK